MKKKTLFLAILCILLLPFGASALSIYLTESNEPALGTANFARVDLSVTPGEANFTVTPDPDGYLFEMGGYSNFGIQKFSFNTSITTGITAADFDFSASGWTVSFNQNAGGGYGFFDLQTSGTGNSRQNPLSFSITNKSIADISQFYLLNNDGYYFAAHIAGFKDGEITSAQFAAPIPEPATMFLMGAGLLGLAAVGRKKIRAA